jgi:acid phosphatase class B
MPITDDGNQPVRLLDGERRADPAEMDYMESQKVFQEQLEKIWDRFKMPMGQRLDMAMKYGKKEDNRRLLDRVTILKFSIKIINQ